ncbi:MAG: ROK family protein [Gemmatimonadetes bacterium]|nr:ROK family protein [Gemmatimonadota bacterium]
MRIGIDLGGTKIEAVALAPDGAERSRLRIPTPRDYEGTLQALADLVRRVEREACGTGPVGVGIPGTVSPVTGLVKNANSTWLIGHPLDRDLATRLGRPVRVMNDANCFALSEASDGAGAGADVVFGVILGTGVGGGVVVGGRPLPGAQLIAGEWGHNPLPWPADDERPGPPCYCGKHGCIETFVSGPGLERDHEQATGRAWTTHRVVEAMAAGDGGARAAYERYVGRLARGLATVVNVLDPDVVVLGGGMSNLPSLPGDVEASLGPWVFTDHVRTRVVRNVHGDSSGVRGAAWLWPSPPAH